MPGNCRCVPGPDIPRYAKKYRATSRLPPRCISLGVTGIAAIQFDAAKRRRSALVGQGSLAKFKRVCADQCEACGAGFRSFLCVLRLAASSRRSVGTPTRQQFNRQPAMKVGHLVKQSGQCLSNGQTGEMLGGGRASPRPCLLIPDMLGYPGIEAEAACPHPVRACCLDQVFSLRPQNPDSVIHTHRPNEGDWLARQRPSTIRESRASVIILIQQVIDIELRCKLSLA